MQIRGNRRLATLEWKDRPGINNAVHDEVERIYLEAWAKGISVPYFKNDKIFLANPDGSDDEVTLDFNTRKYTIVRQVAAPGKGKMGYLLHS